MLTVLKITYANIKQKKFRSILIILSIVLSVALLYTVLSLSNSTQKIFENKVRKEVGSAGYMVTASESSTSRYIPALDFSKISGTEYCIPIITAVGYSQLNGDMVPVTITGMSDRDYMTVYKPEFTQSLSEKLADNQVYIGDKAASEYGLKLGDEITVNIAGIDNILIITAIADDRNNNLGYEIGGLDLVAGRDTLSGLLNLNGSFSAYYLKNVKGTDKSDYLSELKEKFPDYKITDVTDMQSIKEMLNMIVSTLFIMVLAVVMVSAFIIYSSFKIISIERMPFMGTLRSIGATRKTTVRILLFEGAFFGFTGGVLGSGLGIVLLKLTMLIMMKGFNISPEMISYINPGYLLIAVLTGIILAAGSSLLPILKTSGRSIKSIIFAEINNEKHISMLKTFAGIAVISIGYVLFKIAPVKLALPMDFIGLIFIAVGGALVIPFLSAILTRILSLVFKPIYKETFDITTANLKNDRTMMNNILLLAMGLSVILTINNFGTTVGRTVTDLYDKGKSDAVIFYDMDQNFVDKVGNTDGIENVYTVKELLNVKANNGAVKLMYLDGIDVGGYSKYAWDEFGSYLTDKLKKDFNSSRSAIITRFTAKKYNLDKGDWLDIDFNGKAVRYKIIEIVPSIMNNGNMAFVNEEFLKEDAGIDTYQSMYINFKPSVNIKDKIQEIKQLMPYGILPVMTMDEMREQNENNNGMIFGMMKAISIIAMVIGILGILNNFTISFLSRKKLMATMRSLGLSKSKTIRNMLFEAFLCGCLGTLSGLILGTMLLNSMCYVLEALGISSEVLFYSMKDYAFVLISGIILSLASAILPAVRIAKENIVAGLRYE